MTLNYSSTEINENYLCIIKSLAIGIYPFILLNYTNVVSTETKEVLII